MIIVIIDDFVGYRIAPKQNVTPCHRNQPCSLHENCLQIKVIWKNLPGLYINEQYRLVKMMHTINIRERTHRIFIHRKISFLRSISGLGTGILVMALPHFCFNMRYLVVDTFSIKKLQASFALDHLDNFFTYLHLGQSPGRVASANVCFFTAQPLNQVVFGALWV